MPHLFMICHDVVDSRMAGPGIRYWEMARALAQRLDVTLATPGRSLVGEGFASHAYVPGDWETIAAVVSKANAVLLNGNGLMGFPQLTTCGKPLIIEATYPYTFESLHLHSDRPYDEQIPSFTACLETARQTALAGDFFFCAGERQRDYWLGVLDSLGRINPETYGDDSTLNSLIEIVPLGLPSRRPKYTAPAMKGVIPGIGLTDRVVLWGGGLWQWLDPLSLVRAMARVAEECPNVRLVFPGTRHPNPIIPEMPMLRKTQDLSEQMGLAEKTTFLGGWVSYESWPNYLLEADIGVSLHFDTLETHFAFRTRILDYIWAGLPMVVTGGDETSQLVTRYGLGKVVEPGDHEAIAVAILSLLETPDLREAYRQGFEQVRPYFVWERACEPIARFCEQPRLAPDRAAGRPSLQTSDERALSAQVGQLQEQCELQRSELERFQGQWTHQRSEIERLEGQCERQQSEVEQLQSLVQGYEQGRFMRLMRCVHEWRRRLNL